MRFFPLLIVFFGLPSYSNEVVMDGRFDDWKTSEIQIVDPQGDASGKFDVLNMKVKTNQKYVYLRLELKNKLNLQNGNAEDGDFIIYFSNPKGTIKVDLRNRLAEFTGNKGEPRRLSWKELGFTSLPTYASKTHELRIDPSPLGFGLASPINVKVDGSDKVGQFEIRCSGKGLSKKPISLVKEKGALRIANLNTLRQGIADPKRRESIKRLLELSQADVFAFQEEWKEDLFRENVGKVFSFGDSKKSVNVHWNNGCAIATQYKLTPVDIGLERGAAGYIELADGKGLMVVSVHFKCCGYAGSSEDQKRIDTVKQLARRIGDFNKAIPGGLPVVVIGDYNLVGSRDPLTHLERKGFQELVCLKDDLTATTWRGLAETESFWPGRLDIVVSKGLTPLRGQVFDSSLQPNVDTSLSLASDHFMVMGDFRVE